MIERKDLFTIPFYKKTHFSGSYQGMHYRIERIEQDEKKHFACHGISGAVLL